MIATDQRELDFQVRVLSTFSGLGVVLYGLYQTPRKALALSDHGLCSSSSFSCPSTMNGQLHYSCNPFAAFHLDTAWIDFKDASEPCPGNEKINKPFYGGPPVLAGSDSSISSRNMIQGSPTEIMHR